MASSFVVFVFTALILLALYIESNDAFLLFRPSAVTVVRPNVRITSSSSAVAAASSSASSNIPSSSIDELIIDSWVLPKVNGGVNHDTSDTNTPTREEEQVVQVRIAPPTPPTAAAVKEHPKTPFPVILWRFSRPHTLIGSALAIPALHILAAPSFSAIWSQRMLSSILYATIPSLLMNIFITGLNQITDVDIDRINKPYLVIAAGELSPQAASVVVTVCLAISLLMGSIFSSCSLATPGLNFSLWGSAILGTMYSLPPFRLKRFPLIAALCIVAVRGTIINAGFFAHATACVFGPAQATAWSCLRSNIRCQLSSLYFGIFGIIIALMKDVPDLKGDQISNIRTFTVRIGPQKIFHAMRRLLFLLLTSTSLAFAWGSATAALSNPITSSPSSLLAIYRGCIAAVALAVAIQSRTKGLQVNAQDGKEVYNYYMYLWNIFYQSYLVLPFAR